MLNTALVGSIITSHHSSRSPDGVSMMDNGWAAARADHCYTEVPSGAVTCHTLVTLSRVTHHTCAPPRLPAPTDCPALVRCGGHGGGNMSRGRGQPALHSPCDTSHVTPCHAPAPPDTILMSILLSLPCLACAVQCTLYLGYTQISPEPTSGKSAECVYLYFYCTLKRTTVRVK